MDYGYEGTAVFPLTFQPPRKLPLGTWTLKRTFDGLCAEKCAFLEKAYLGLNLKVIPQTSSQTNKLINAAVGAEPVKASSSVKIAVTATRDMLTLSVVTGKKETSAEYYPVDDDSIRNAGRTEDRVHT